MLRGVSSGDDRRQQALDYLPAQALGSLFRIECGGYTQGLLTELSAKRLRGSNLANKSPCRVGLDIPAPSNLF